MRAKVRAIVAFALTPLAAAPAMSADYQNLPQRLLVAHNQARAVLGVPPLHWDAALAASAAGWAANLARRGAFEHSDNRGDMGENLWAGTPGVFSPEKMVARWAAERQIFKPGVFPDNSKTGDWEQVGHYTQMVWRTTTAVGCALAKGSRADVLVCRDAPAGNVVGEMPF
jgi:Cysteine-rich secretory protein family